MRPNRKCASSGAHFSLFWASVFTLFFSFTGAAHTVVLSEFSLARESEQWVLSFDQKTSQLRDAIYAFRPDLKGTNLNSEEFKEATRKYVVSNLFLKYQGELLQIVPRSMHYGGLRFESTFLVEGLARKPDLLTIQVESFDAHEHSIVLFRIAEEQDGSLNYFNQNQRLATFDFNTKRYVFGDIQPNGKNKLQFILYGVLFLILLGGAARLFQARTTQ